MLLNGDPDPYKRGDRRRRRTVGRIKCGDGDGGEPVRGPSRRDLPLGYHHRLAYHQEKTKPAIDQDVY
jgi:hypothetical protein